MRAWADEVGYGGDLLCDVDRAVAMAYGAADSPDQERPKRISVLIEPDGRVAKLYDVADAVAHPAHALDDLT